MKKFILVLVLAAVLATGTAFAQHPDGFGIGVLGRWDIDFIGTDDSHWGGGGVALSLKIPKVPIFWAFNVGFGADYFAFGFTGDYYIIDKIFAQDIRLGWYLGVGVFFNFIMIDYSLWGYKYERNDISVGGRVPVGIYWLATDLIELFLEVAPSLGAGIRGDTKVSYGSISSTTEGNTKFYFSLPMAFGIRFWL